jgi:small-conductance mechanosensitive channel
MLTWLQLHGIRIFITLVIGAVLYIVVQYLIPHLVRRTTELGMDRKHEVEIQKRSRTLIRVLRTTCAFIIGVIVLITILADVGVNIGPALASLGVLGIAVGFGAQNLVKDFINGLFILMENQYGIGDVVKVGGICGLVEELNLRRTILRDLDGVVHIIPNGEIQIASNFTKEFSRVNMNVSVSYNEDLDRVITVINDVCNRMSESEAWKGKLIKKPQVLRVDALGDSGIEIKIMGDTVPLAQWEVMGELRRRIKVEFDKQGIEIPWPHMKVYFGSQPPSGDPHS